MHRLLPVVALLALSTGLAQRVTFPTSTYDLQACSRVTQGVKCDFQYTPLQEETKYFQTSWFTAVGVDGRNIQASALSIAGSSWQTTYQVSSLKTYTNVPVRVSALFEVEASVFPVLSIAGQTMREITVSSTVTPARAAPAPVKAETTTSQATTRPSYAATLTDCRSRAGGVLVCTATLTPRK